MYKINGMYYLVAAEGGTEFGHMVTYARGNSPYGPFESFSHNPVLTNRNLGGYEIQGVGHGDLIQDDSGNWWMLHLGFRQSGQWIPFHHLGREVFLTPVVFDEEGWFLAGYKGTTLKSFTIDRKGSALIQNEKKLYTFENTKWDIDWCYLRAPNYDNYILGKDIIKLRGTDITLDQADSPTFIGLRQKDFTPDISCEISILEGEAGITIYMDEYHHYDLAIRKNRNQFEAIERLNIGDIKAIQQTVDLNHNNKIKLIIHSSNKQYEFYIEKEGQKIFLGSAWAKYLSSEVAGGFTGVIIGLYTQGKNCSEYAEFSNFVCQYL